MLSNAFRIIRILLKYQLIESLKLSLIARISIKICTLFLAPAALFHKSRAAPSENLVKALEELGPLYIKFGQIASTRPDLVGNEIAKALAQLQDQATPFAFAITERILARNFPTPRLTLFKEFNLIPVASASIAQVYQATLPDNNIVAVKILRPQVKLHYQQALDFLSSLATCLTYLSPKLKRLKPHAALQILKDVMHTELDLRMEAAAYSEMQDCFSNNPDLHLPQVYWHLTTEEVLTTAWVDGTSIYAREILEQQGFDCKQLATKLAVISFEQTYKHGFFHADLHAGNILITKHGQIALLDFGIMGRLAMNDRLAIAEILYSFLHRDYMRVAIAHANAGYIPKTVDLALFAQACRAVGEPIRDLPLHQISIGKLLAQLFKITENFGIEARPQLILLQKTMLMLEGIGQTLDPEINMWYLARPWITTWAIQNLSIEAKVLKMCQKLGNKISKIIFED